MGGYHPVVGIIGGGFTGAAVAFHLARRDFRGRILVFEPRSTLGAGLAYGTTDPSHRINVPASRMSLMPTREDDFAVWLADHGYLSDDPEAASTDGHVYARRSAVGAYVSSALEPYLEARAVEHLRSRVARVERVGERWRTTTEWGHVSEVDILVIATTHPAPAVPRALAKALKPGPHLIPDATLPNALAHIDTSARVLIVGTGLTMADVVATLYARGHQGAILALSRHGLLSRTHAARKSEPFGHFAYSVFTALKLLQAIRSTIRVAEASGIPWQAVIDAVRAQAQQFWPLMNFTEKKRVLRHLRPFWDVHRFRIAPQVHAVIERLKAERRLSIIAGSIEGAEETPAGVRVRYRERGHHDVSTTDVDVVITTTGPDHASIVQSQPFLADLARAGWIKADDLGLGIATANTGHAICASGAACEELYVAGPLARATFGELMGLPQVAEYAEAIADEIFSGLWLKGRALSVGAASS